MRASLDYGCVAYMSESHLNKLDVEQAQGLRICSGVFKTSSVAAMQVEMGDEPLRIRRIRLMLAYWIILWSRVDHTLQRLSCRSARSTVNQILEALYG